MKTLKISTTLAALLVWFAAASFTNLTHATNIMEPAAYTPPVSGAALDKATSHPKRHLVLVTKQGTIKIQLFDKVAPNHVAQIIKLTKTHVYDGTTFHRIIPGFMIQGGDPNSKDDDLSNDGTGGAGSPLKAEFNDIHHARGICSMARTQDPNSATSQFFIVHGESGFLDKQYTVWGQVTDGMDVVDKIVTLKKIQGDNPGKAAEIIKATIEGE